MLHSGISWAHFPHATREVIGIISDQIFILGVKNILMCLPYPNKHALL